MKDNKKWKNRSLEDILLIKNKLKKQIKKMRKGEYSLCWKKAFKNKGLKEA